MQFTHGNQLWRRVKNPGRPPKFPYAMTLWNSCVEYFEHEIQGTYVAEKPGATDEEGNVKLVLRRRPFSQRNLCTYLGIHIDTWLDWKKSRPDFSGVIAMVEQIIFQDKYDGAAIGVFSERLMSRDLGLIDKSETKVVLNAHEEFIKNLQPFEPVE